MEAQDVDGEMVNYDAPAARLTATRGQDLGGGGDQPEDRKAWSLRPVDQRGRGIDCG